MKTNKKTNIRTVIRKIVREEVAVAIQEVITELKQPTQPTKSVEKQSFTKNKVLNDVLNETANDNSEWKTMGGETFNSSKMNDVIGKSYGNMMNDTSQPTTTIAREMGVDPNDPANSFLTKDYRKVMKAIDKKQGK